MGTDYDRLLLESKQGEPVMTGNGVVIGTIFGSRFFKVIHNTHILNTPPAIAIDKEVFAKRIQVKCSCIFILEKDSFTIYSSSVDNFIKHSFYLDRRFGGQLAMSMEYWSKNRGVVQQVAMRL